MAKVCAQSGEWRGVSSFQSIAPTRMPLFSPQADKVSAMETKESIG